jgi:hypothetical protein
VNEVDMLNVVGDIKAMEIMVVKVVVDQKPLLLRQLGMTELRIALFNNNGVLIGYLLPILFE